MFSIVTFAAESFRNGQPYRHHRPTEKSSSLPSRMTAPYLKGQRHLIDDSVLEEHGSSGEDEGLPTRGQYLGQMLLSILSSSKFVLTYIFKFHAMFIIRANFHLHDQFHFFTIFDLSYLPSACQIQLTSSTFIPFAIFPDCQLPFSPTMSIVIFTIFLNSHIYQSCQLPFSPSVSFAICAIFPICADYHYTNCCVYQSCRVQS